MIARHAEAVYQVLGAVRDQLVAFISPVAVLLGLLTVAGTVAIALRRDIGWPDRRAWQPYAAAVVGYTAAGVLAVACWAVLSTTHPLARQDIQWRESAEATVNPTPDAPPVYQFGPALATLVERTYTRTLALPPAFLERVGAEGLGVLAPYLSDPSAENVLRLVDTFRRSGTDVVFTRQVTRLDEETMPFDRSEVRVRFRRLSGRAYDAEFRGQYAFGNATDDPITARFMFPLPDAGTVRDLSVRVGGQPVTGPNESGAYEWRAVMAPGEQRQAVVHYQVVGARSWHYDLGSRRRRVHSFRLEAVPGGPVRFPRGSLQPTTATGSTLRWDLANVVTAQQVALTFAPDTIGRDCYLQALTALPESLLLFLAGALLVGLGSRQVPGAGPLAGGLLLFTLGLGAVPVLASYVGTVGAVLVGPLAGAGAAVGVLGVRSALAALPAALLPAAFLSPRHSGLLVLLLAALTAVAARVWARRWKRAA